MSKLALPSRPLKFLFFFLRPYLWSFLCLILIACLWAINTSLEPYLIKLMLDTLETAPQETENLFYQLRQPVLIYVFLRIFTNMVNRVYDYVSLKFLPQFNKDIIIKMTEYIQNHSHSYFHQHFGGSVVSKISTAADTAESLIDSLIYHFVFPFFTLGIAAWTMAGVDSILAVILLVWVTIFMGCSYYFSLRVHNLSEQLSEKYTALIGKLIDSITNILAVRLFARRKYEVSLLESAAQEKASKAQELQWNDLKRQAVMEILANLLVGVLIYYLILERQKGMVSIGDFALILTLSLSIIDVIWNMSRNYLRFVENIGKCSQALKILTTPHEIKDDLKAVPLVITRGTIKFKKVTFSYQASRKALFQELSLTIKGGEKVGVVGYSGSGKTTFVNLIVRLFDVQSGSILIDGQDIKKVTQDSLHQNISFIPQEPMLFHRTILENIRYGNLDATQEDIVKAAQKANAHEFIKALPQGYDTLVGERGTTLSGGQRQRLAIARAILKNAKILILDEATSALDSATEYYIQESLDILMKDKTVLVVAHRLSTLLKMDRIIVFENGRIVEEGNHQALLIQNGLYTTFWYMQANSAHKETPQSSIIS